MNLSAPEKFVHTGSKISALTQSDLYKGILEKRQTPERQTTSIQLDITRWAVNDLSGKLPTDEKIWKSIRHKDITRSIRNFLWKSLHGAHKCGKFWENIPNHEQRAMCPVCNVEESMDHILLECSAPGQKTIWNLAKTLWQSKHNIWPNITYGTTLGCGMSNFKNEKGETSKGTNRLFRILITESTHLIWKLRCERRIANEDNPEKHHTEAEVQYITDG
jgi:hypothetical protein